MNSFRERTKDFYFCVVGGVAMVGIFLQKSIFRRSVAGERRLLIVKLDHIGDYVLFRNFLQEIKKSERYRGYGITLCGNEQIRSLAEWLDHDSVDEFLWVNKKKVFRNPFYLYRILFRLYGRFAIAMQPTYSRELMGDLFIKFSIAPERFGLNGDCNCISRGDKKRTDAWYTRLISVDPESTFEFFKNKDFFEQLLGARLPIARPTIDKYFASAAISKGSPLSVQKKFVVLFPGASLALRRWPAAKFAALGDYMETRYGYKIVIAGAPFDRPLALSIMSHSSRKDFFDFTSKTSLPELAGLFAMAELIISNDTSAVHFGAAMDVKTVVLSQYNLYGRFVPYPSEMVDDKMICVTPATYAGLNKEDLIKKFAEGSDEDIDLITVDRAKKAVDKILINHNK